MLILWEGLDQKSFEHCTIEETIHEIMIKSVIVGHKENIIFKVEYNLILNKKWETISINLASTNGKKKTEYCYHRNEKGQWIANGSIESEFSKCIEIDISLTPLTNSLPINRLKLSDEESGEIDVVYFDILEDLIYASKQIYTRKSAREYHFTGIKDGFEADITVDANNFVEEYQGLFRMRGMRE